MEQQMMMKIGAVATRADVNIQTVRYYERRGLLAKPPRTESNYRLYSEDSVRRVRFVKRAQQLGFTLKEIKDLLALRLKPTSRSSAVKERATAKIADVEHKIRALQRMKRTLTKLTAACDGCGSTSECPILEALES